MMRETNLSKPHRGRLATLMVALLNYAMIAAGVWLIYMVAGAIAALGVILVIWGWTAITTRNCTALAVGAADGVEGVLSDAGLADAGEVATANQALDDRILDLEGRLEELQEKRAEEAWCVDRCQRYAHSLRCSPASSNSLRHTSTSSRASIPSLTWLSPI